MAATVRIFPSPDAAGTNPAVEAVTGSRLLAAQPVSADNMQAAKAVRIEDVGVTGRQKNQIFGAFRAESGLKFLHLAI